MPDQQIKQLFSDILDRGLLKKAVFSKPEDKSVLKAVASPAKKTDGSVYVKLERFTRDNKVYQTNLAPDGSCACELCALSLDEFRQVNLFTTAGDLEIRRSKSGSTHVSGRLGEEGEKAEAAPDGKHYLIDPSRDAAFLRELGLADASGRIHDKKQAKFRQINRFLELIRDVEDELPKDRPAVICDLCCGKSYLTFAVCYYFTVLLGREVRMTGVDLKADVIAFCNEAAKRQHFDSLSFVSGNINEYEPPEAPDMVISLHACDIATDIVLYNAVRWKTKIILSTPCCHHEMAKQLNEKADDAPLRKEFGFILSSPLLKQKLCDAMTDALRVKRLEACGYDVTTLELIDPDETPKNLMIRAVFDGTHPAREKAAKDEYDRIVRSLAVDPCLDRLFREAGTQ